MAIRCRQAGIPCHRSASSLFWLSLCVCVRICITGAGNGRTGRPGNRSLLILEDNQVVNKRTCLKVLTSLLAMPVVSPVLAWALGNKLQNWAGNFEYSTERLYSANSLEQVRKVVRKQPNLKVLGTRHCFNKIADSTHYLLSLKAMEKVVALDPEARTVTLEAGVTYGQLCPY